MFSLSSPPHTNLYFAKHTPQTPSPLRTSQNANRLTMSRATKSSPISESWRDGDENWSPTANVQISATPLTRFSGPITNVDDWAIKTPVTGTTTASNNFIFTPTSTSSLTSASTSSASSTAKTSFAYESRARSSSPAAQISKHVMNGRERRKTQFLDKIRSRRTEGRDDRMEEKVLRMDFVNERRMWEEAMRRRADIEKEADEAADTKMDIGEVEDQNEGVSPTEEREIEELISYLNEDEPGDDGYEELFMEMIGEELQIHQQRGDQMDMS